MLRADVLQLIMTNNDSQYFEYLKQRSFTGLLYRKHLLYPKLSRELFGTTLDVGCGIGDFLAFRPSSYGIDINPQLVEFCVNRGFRASVMLANKIPYSDEFFESIVFDNVLEHILEPIPLLKEMWRVMKPKGRLIVGVPGVKGFELDSDHKVFYTEAQLVSLFVTQKWKKVKVFAMPIRSTWLNHRMRQYCIYACFEKPVQQPLFLQAVTN
jgi:SAM-dependent methyltransferase